MNLAVDFPYFIFDFHPLCVIPLLVSSMKWISLGQLYINKKKKKKKSKIHLGQLYKKVFSKIDLGQLYKKKINK